MLTAEQRAGYEELDGYLQSSNQAASDAIRALLADLEEAETAYDTAYEVWQRTELQNQELKAELAATRKQLAEVQAREKALRDTLEWYANGNHFVALHGIESQPESRKALEGRGFDGYGVGNSDIYIERGDKAQAIIDELDNADTAALSAAIAEAVEPYKPIVELAKRIVENKRNDQYVVLTVDVAALEAAIAALAAKEDKHG